MKYTRIISICCLLGLLHAVSGATAVVAQTPDPIHGTGPAVHLVNNLSFSNLQRFTSRSIHYLDGDAALFIVDAEAGRTVILNITNQELAHASEAAGGRGRMKLNICKNDCAYSIDNGLTWNEFNTSLHNQRVHLPSGAGTPPVYQILVRIGGTVTANHNQRRGGYAGELTLGVEYQ